MKRNITLILFALISIASFAQMGAMTFAGPSKFGVASMNAWQENEKDEFIFQMTSMSEADITFPALTYNAMKLTIPSFTVKGLKFTFDDSRNATFADQTFESTITTDEGAEKKITGTSFVGEYNHAAKSFSFTATFNYGTMPFPVTFIIDAEYVSPTSIRILDVKGNTSQPIYDLSGRIITTPSAGNIYVVGGRKTVWK